MISAQHLGMVVLSLIDAFITFCSTSNVITYQTESDLGNFRIAMFCALFRAFILLYNQFIVVALMFVRALLHLLLVVRACILHMFYNLRYVALLSYQVCVVFVF